MQKHKRMYWLMLVLLTSYFITGCGPGQLLGPEFTSTPAFSQTPSLTPSHTPTQTPSPTKTPTVTPTVTIEPMPLLSEFLINPRLTFYDSFDNYDLENWRLKDCQSIETGELKYDCTDQHLVRKTIFHEGEGIIMDFKLEEQLSDYWWAISFFSGEFEHDSFRSFGIASASDGWQAALFSTGDDSESIDLSWIEPNIWHRLVLAIGKEGQILMLAWERDNPNANPWSFTNQFGSEWSELEWQFWVNNTQDVTLYFDNFYEIKFDDIQ